MWIARVLACIRRQPILARKRSEAAPEADGPMSDRELARALREFNEWKTGAAAARPTPDNRGPDPR